MIDKIVVYSDGGSRGNPGPAAVGAVVSYPCGDKFELSRYIGEATNNIAEYMAVYEALKEIAKRFSEKELRRKQIVCYLDSELIVKQMKGEYRIKNADLLKIYLKIQDLISLADKVKFIHIRREKNKEADKLVNLALDRAINLKSKN
ncbi:MAG: reverse transcriptase-like protein [Candidatus Moranbacteria bacterium]|nr:reverse transcriptase-like protein [Candidatus Moranbacteria bacterium]